MNNSQITQALQDLIIRLQDAEKGYNEIKLASSNASLRQWLSTYANERHQMHRELEKLSSKYGSNAEVKTSILGKIHRMFIDIKINAVDDDFTAIANEIERGSNALINDYKKILSEVELPADVVSTLNTQKEMIAFELKQILKLKEELIAVEA